MNRTQQQKFIKMASVKKRESRGSKTPMTKSQSMARVRQKNTKPELALRKVLWAAGFRYRIHDKRLPGRPDISLGPAKIAIFVHGCFWHGHSCKRGCRKAKTNAEFWNEKIQANRARDAATIERLNHLGWSTILAWECSVLQNPPGSIEQLRQVRIREMARLQKGNVGNKQYASQIAEILAADLFEAN